MRLPHPASVFFNQNFTLLFSFALRDWTSNTFLGSTPPSIQFQFLVRVFLFLGFAIHNTVLDDTLLTNNGSSYSVAIAGWKENRNWEGCKGVDGKKFKKYI